ncbi:MAG: ABC transporter substrate-binding protein [Motiliproteus sp.]
MAEQVSSNHSRGTHLGVLKAAFEYTGSPHWIMYCIQRLGLDKQFGFELQIDYMDDKMRGPRHSTEQALVDGEVDFIDTDWMTLARFRQQGLAVSAVYPYGRILGGLLVAADSKIESVAQLQGCSLGVVGRSDKNWILTQAYAKKVHQIDLAEQVQLRHASSKSELQQWLQQRQVDAGLVYWHQIPELTRQHGYRLLLDIPTILPALGMPSTPTTFFLFRDAFVESHPELIEAYIQAFQAAVNQLQHDDALWQEIADKILNLDDAEQLAGLRDVWSSRISGSWSGTNIKMLQVFYQQLQQLTGESFAAGNRMPDGCFNWQFMQPAAVLCDQLASEQPSNRIAL